ncbi:hypothetical protein BJ166DRAFT_539302 [Pestalotiopsis sp. NC0098]|nr:hypothetical protein BJ166DRAFT_539302 [Pestalotiopsis sp. NC0098]
MVVVSLDLKQLSRMRSFINGSRFTVASLPGSHNETLRKTSQSPSYIILKTRSPIQRTEKHKLEALYVDVKQHLGDNAW